MTITVHVQPQNDPEGRLMVALRDRDGHGNVTRNEVMKVPQEGLELTLWDTRDLRFYEAPRGG